MNPTTITLENTTEEAFTDVAVREDADGMSAIFTALPEGAQVTVLAVEGDWAMVLVDGQPGYIFASDLAAWMDLNAAEETEQKVTVFSSRRSVMHVGERIELTSRLEGFEGMALTYQWERDTHDGQGYQPVDGAREASYAFNATAETLRWDWRLVVHYTQG